MKFFIGLVLFLFMPIAALPALVDCMSPVGAAVVIAVGVSLYISYSISDKRRRQNAD